MQMHFRATFIVSGLGVTRVPQDRGALEGVQ